MIVGLIGVYFSIQHWHASTALTDTNSFSSYLTFVNLEVILCAVGAIILTRYKKQSYIAPWICLIVGIHFIPLKSVFQDSSLYLLAALLTVVSLLSIVLSKKLAISKSALTGLGAGIVLFSFAISGLIRFFMV